MKITPHSELTWGGGVPGIFVGRHSFLLSDRPNGGTRLVHKERFSAFASLEAIDAGYELMNQRLKQRAETPVRPVSGD